jgi:hypothetical protein
LGLLWAVWWTLFATAEAIVNTYRNPSTGPRELGVATVFALVLFGSVAIAWEWPLLGGPLLILASAASVALWGPMWVRRFGIWEVLLLVAIMPLPPLAAGVLFLLFRHRHTPPPPLHAR